MDEGEEDYIFIGRPIEREEETSARKRKAVADAGQLRTLPPWKQEVIDEEGRRRFHGAFTGGFSAGYYNTVGSKEGWAPQTFTSSRKNRAGVKKQSIYSFLDDDEKAEMEGHALETSLQFDTFGFTAAELARKQAEKEQQKRPSAIPGPVPDELVLPAANSIGVKLLQKMGWRLGHSIKDTHTDSLYGARREARKAFLAFSGNEEGPELAEIESYKSDSENVIERDSNGVYFSQSTPFFVVNPKQDLHGLGYDPFKHAPEFRERKRLRVSGNKDQGTRSTVSKRDNLFASNGKFAPGFGIGALEEPDIEDEDIYASGFEFEETYVEEDEQPSRISRDVKLQLQHRAQDGLSGFKVSSCTDYSIERFQPPDIPPDFVPRHKFPAPLDAASKFLDSPPPEVSPPEDNNLRLLIEGFASLVSRCGKLFEDLSKEKHKANPLFCFLNGGNGHDYYARKLWEEHQKRVDQPKQHVDVKSFSSVQKMTAENRGRILGERPLERSSNDSSSSISLSSVVHLQSNLSDTFTKSSSLVGFSESAKPFKNDPAKQERFEQFLKDKYQGGLRSMYTGGTNNMSETNRAREKLDFEAAAEAIEKGELITKTSPLSSQQFMHLPVISGRHFISGGVEQKQVHRNEEIVDKTYPKREEFEWRPSPILCKRFDIIDPFMGKPPPLPRARSKMDSLIFIPDSVRTVKVEETGDAAKASSSLSQSDVQETKTLMTSEEPIEQNNTSVQRPVDLYKAIFSDDSDDEGENTVLSQLDDPEEKTEGVNTTLNRLIAGDFLESLGKELGLDIPSDASYPLNATDALTSQKESTAIGDQKISSRNDRSASTPETCEVLEVNAAISDKLLLSSDKECKKEVFGKVDPARKDGTGHANPQNGPPTMVSLPGAGGNNCTEGKTSKFETEKMQYHSGRHRTRSRHHRSRSSTSDSNTSCDRRSQDRFRSREKKRVSSHGKSRHRSRSSASYSDSSSDHRSHDRSRSKAERSSSSHRKSRKHSKHHTHRSKKSPSRYSSQGTDKDFTDDKRENRKSRDHRSDTIFSNSDVHSKYH